MSVWIIWFKNFYGDDEWAGIYSTQEIAQKRAEELKNSTDSTLRVEEYILDSE